MEKVTVTVKLHADDSAADGNRAVTSKVNRPAISPDVNVGVAAARRPPAGKVVSPKTGKKLFLAKGLVTSYMLDVTHTKEYGKCNTTFISVDMKCFINDWLSNMKSANCVVLHNNVL